MRRAHSVASGAGAALRLPLSRWSVLSFQNYKVFCVIIFDFSLSNFTTFLTLRLPHPYQFQVKKRIRTVTASEIPDVGKFWEFDSWRGAYRID
jgi:hypothetical protein